MSIDLKFSERDNKSKGNYLPLFSWKIRIVWLVVAIMLLGGILRFYHIGADSLWFDDISSIDKASQKSLQDVWFRVRMTEVTPPLYFMFLHYWVLIFGISETAIRTLSALVGTLAIPLMYFLGKKLFNKQVGLAAAFLLTISPFHIYHSQDARPYALLVILTLASVLSYLRLLNSGQKIFWWVAYILSTCLLLYTSYVALFYILAQNVYTIYQYRVDKKRIQIGVWFLSQVLIFLFFIPWLVYLFSESQQHTMSHIQSLGSETRKWFHFMTTAKFIWRTFFNFSVGQDFYLMPNPLFLIILTPIVFVPIFLRGVIGIVNQREKFVFITVHLVVPLFVAGIISLLNLKWMYTRYLIQASLFYYLILACGLVCFRSKWTKIAAVTAIIGMSVFYPYKYYFDPNYQQEDWRTAAKYIADEGTSEDLLLINLPHDPPVFTYYYKGNIEWYGLTSKREVVTKIEKLTMGRDRVWVIFSHTDAKRGRKAIEDWMSERYRVGARKILPGVEIYLYIRNSDKS